MTHLDTVSADTYKEQIADPAEEAVREIISGWPGFVTRPATEAEDAGPQGIGRGKKVDVVTYIQGKPAFAVQVTTAQDRRVREAKVHDLMDQPFVRLDEMGQADTAIPKFLVYLDAATVAKMNADPNLFRQSDVQQLIMKQILINIPVLRRWTQYLPEQRYLDSLKQTLVEVQKTIQ